MAKKNKKKASVKNTSKKNKSKKKVTKKSARRVTKPVNRKSTTKSKASSKKVQKKKFSFSNFNKWGVIFVAALLLIAVFLGITAIKKNMSRNEISFDKISANKFLKLYDSSSKNLDFVYLTSDNCYSCNKYEINLNKLSNEYKIKIYELNISELSDKEIKSIKDSSEFLSNTLETPILLSLKDGKEINHINGEKEYYALKKFVEYSKNPISNGFIEINLNKFIALLGSKDTTVIYIGSSIDKACTAFSKTLETVSSKLNIKVNYLDTEEIITEDGWNKLKESNELFSKEWFWPTTLIVKNGKIVDYKMESMNEEDLTNFFSKNGI